LPDFRAESVAGPFRQGSGIHFAVLADRIGLQWRFLVRQQTRQIIKKIPVLGKPYAQRDELRRVVNKLWETPGHYYSPIPELDDIRRNEARVFGTAPRTLPGIDLNERAQLALLTDLASFYADQPFSDEPRNGLRYGFDNPAFSYCDAIMLHCLIRHAKPRQIVEVGSGYSSCLMLDINERFFGGSISCTFIEPYPRLLKSLLKRDDVERASILVCKLQDVDGDVFASLSDGDILFIDSSHVAKTNSDVNYVFFEVLPRLGPGVRVHFHDIFYPFEYPKEWVYQGRAWNEAYVLRAFLQHNDRFKIELFNSFLERFHADTLTRLMPLTNRYASSSMIPTSAQSLWLRKR
jgi:predicted O-methyltransferase YrrM